MIPNKTKPVDEFIRHVEIVRVIDGDTLEVVIDLGFKAAITYHIRLAGANTPEKRGVERPAGLFAKKAVHQWLGKNRSGMIHSLRFRVGSFDRCICDVWVGDSCLNHYLLKNGLAWPTDDNGKIIGPRDVSLLTGIPEGLKQQCRELGA